MKAIKIFLIILVISLASCTEDFLDQQNPNRQTTDNFWKTEADLEAAMATCYNRHTHTWTYYGDLGVHTQEVRTENYGWISGANDNCRIETFINEPTNAFSNDYYSASYRGIFYCNQVIQYGGAMDIAQDIKDKYVAEARFLRGLYYFILVTNFGEVPIHSKVPETKEDFRLAKSSVEEVWNRVESDFTDAAAGLPMLRPSDNSEAGRATKGAALAYLGRALLYQKKWAEAQTILKSIVDNESAYHYGLRPNYAELFDGQHENENGGIIEGVYEMQKSAVLSQEWSNYTTLLEILAGPTEVGGWDYFYARPALRDAFLEEPAADGGFDPRATATIAWDYPGCVFYQRDFHASFNNSRIYHKKYANWWNSWVTSKSELDVYGMRYADVLLMLAEAYTMQNNVAAAAPLVKRIRDRAKLADKNMSGYSQDQMMAEIRRQRNLEFAYEGLHWYDLQRWGLFETVIKASDEPGKENYTSKYEYFPIPQPELDANPNMTQSDAWE